jgi:transposase
MDNQDVSYIAIDVAKNSFWVQTDGGGFLVANTVKGIAQMLSKTRSLKNRHFVCEASGGYERTLVDTLHAKKHTVSLLPAAWVRAFASSDGIKAKTDPIDGRVILRFAKEKRPAATPPPSAQQRLLVDLLDRREQLTEQLKREKTRLQKPGCAKAIIASTERMIRSTTRELGKIDAQIEKTVESDKMMTKAFGVLTSIKGIGPVNAWSIIAYLPEITNVNRTEIAALAGLAPFNRDSGNRQGPRHIFGGRAKVRRCLYMAATAAAIHNEVISTYVCRLQARGKPYKCAIVAAMRKLLLHAQSILKKDEIVLA